MLELKTQKYSLPLPEIRAVDWPCLPRFVVKKASFLSKKGGFLVGSSTLTFFFKEMRLIFPNSQRINRGNYVIKEVVDACKANEVTDLVILHEHRGQPDGMVVCHFPYGPTTYYTLHNVVLRHDIPDRGTVSEQYPHLIFHNFNSKLGTRIQNTLKYLFPVPKEDAKRVMTFSNENDYISFRYGLVGIEGGGVSVCVCCRRIGHYDC